MAIEAKMGMCIVVILISAFGFLVYRKFDARQRSLLQANLQAAETALPGSTGGGEDNLYAEFQPSDQILNGKPATEGQALSGSQSATDVLSTESNVDTTFGSSFALRETATLSPPEKTPLESTTEDAFAGNSFDHNGFAGLDEPGLGADDQNAKVPEESTKLAFAGEPAGSQLAGQISSPMDDYLAQRQTRETVAEAVDPSSNDSAFASFGDPELSAQTAAPSGGAAGESMKDIQVADASPFDALMEPETGGQTSAPSTFEGFPGGFESQQDTIVGTSTANSGLSQAAVAGDDVAKTGQADEQPWPDFGQDATSDMESPLNRQLAAELPDKAVDIQTDEWAPVKPSSQQPSPAFANFDSFEVDAKDKTNQPTGELESADADSPFQKRDESGVTSGQLLASTDEPASAAAAFESFGSDDGFEYSSSNSASIRVLQPAPEAPAAAPETTSNTTASPPGFDETFAMSPQVDDDSLTSAADSFAGTQQDLTTRRGPLVDPSSVMQPLTGDDGTKLISNTDRSSYDDRFNDSVPMPVEAGLAESFNGPADSPSYPAEQSYQAAGELRMPSIPAVTEPVAAKSASGTIQQVSATRDPDGIYTVQDDDTYWTISKHVYGTARFFSSLALYNKNRIKDPRRLRKGMKVVIPDPEVLIERYPELLQDYIPKESKPSGYFLKANGMPAYRIGERETLSEISQKHLGRASRWIQLYRMNQQVLQNPNRLKPGTVIDLPDDATNVHVVP